MDRKSKILFWALGALVIISIALTYYRSFVSRDYEIIQTEESSEEVVEVAQ